MKKVNWAEIREEVVNALKFTIFIVTTLLGFWVGFAFIWIAVGLPQTNWALWLLFGLALGCDWLFAKWLAN
jgi:hypothetical protein